MQAKQQLERIIATKLEAASSQHNTQAVIRFARLYVPLSMQVPRPVICKHALSRQGSTSA